MSSRQEEKEQRKRERLERERAAAQAAKRKRLAQMVGGAIVVLAVLAGVVFAATNSGGGDDGPSSSSDSGVPIPSQREDDLEKAVMAAGCTLKAFPDEGQQHVSDALTAKDYKTNPPTSGNHNPTPAQDGIYDPGNSPKLENWVHTLEHGRIILMYKPGTPMRRVQQLETLFSEPVAGGPEGYHMVLMENNTEMPFAVAAVAWRNHVGCPQFDDRVFDAFRAFRDRYVDKAPEQVP